MWFLNAPQRRHPASQSDKQLFAACKSCSRHICVFQTLAKACNSSNDESSNQTQCGYHLLSMAYVSSRPIHQPGRLCAKKIPNITFQVRSTLFIYRNENWKKLWINNRKRIAWTFVSLWRRGECGREERREQSWDELLKWEFFFRICLDGGLLETGWVVLIWSTPSAY